jgi:hypothetical protein
MRCDEIQEGFIDLLYGETGSSKKELEMLEHLRACPDCLRELDELKKTRQYLQHWKDESPLQSIAITSRISQTRNSYWKTLRYAGIAAMFLITLLALANTRITFSKEGFAFSATLFPKRNAQQDYYTKVESRRIMKQALDDSELRTNETNLLMMQKVLDTVEQSRWNDLLAMRNQLARNDRN